MVCLVSYHNQALESQALERCQAHGGYPVFVDQVSEEMKELDPLGKWIWLDHTKLPKKQPEPSVHLKLSPLATACWAGVGSPAELLVRVSMWTR